MFPHQLAKVVNRVAEEGRQRKVIRPLQALLRRHVLVVRVARGHLQRDVRRDDCRVVADRLEEDHGEALLARDALLDLVPDRGCVDCKLNSLFGDR